MPVDLARCLAELADARSELGAVLAAWDQLPEAVRAGIRAMVAAATHE